MKPVPFMPPTSQVMDSFKPMDYVPIGICVLASDWTVVYWNACLEKWTGLSRTDILNHRITHFFPHLLTQEFVIGIKHVFQDQAQINFSSEHLPSFPSIRDQNGNLREFHIIASSIPGASGQRYALLAIQDVSTLSLQFHTHKIMREQAEQEVKERKLAQAALARLSRLHELILRAAGNAIAGLDCDGNIVFANPAAADVLGWEGGSLIGCNFHAIIQHPCHINQENGSICAMIRTLRGGETTRVLEDVFFSQNENRIFVEFEMTPILENSMIVGAVVTFKDISERKALEQKIFRYTEKLEEEVDRRTVQIRQLEQRRMHVEKLAALAQVAAGVAHEINNPLAGIKNSFQLLKGEISQQHPRFHYVGKIEQEIDRITAIIKRMYELYRPGPVRPSRVNGKEFLKDVSQMMNGFIRQRQQQIVLDSHPEFNELHLPMQDVVQVLCNLIQNASQASPPHEDIFLIGMKNSKEIRISVSDRGEGILPQHLPFIFDPFFTTKTGSTTGGMGLGLSVSRSLVQAMGGEILVETRLRKGTTFTVCIPILGGSPN